MTVRQSLLAILDRGDCYGSQLRAEITCNIVRNVVGLSVPERRVTRGDAPAPVDQEDDAC